VIELRPYQLDAIERCRREVARGRRRLILVAPTGSGKTVIASAIVAGAAEKSRRALFLAHRRELVQQAADKLGHGGVDAGMVLPGYPSRPEQFVQVASVQSLTARPIRSNLIDLPNADLIVVDEAHHATAATYRAILEAYPDAVILGLSATPARADGRGLGNVFDCIVECPSVAELTRAGFLVPAKVFAPPPPDLEGVAVRRGDYAEAELAERMDKPTLVGDIVQHWHRHAEGRRTVVFATSVAHAVHIRDEFARAGVVAAHLDGSTPLDERDDILARLAAGTVDVVTNCAVLNEGWDCPAVGCVVLARPTKSLGLYRQMAGRVLRPYSGKQNAIVLDHAGSTFVHGFVDDDIAWSLREDHRAENKAHAARGTYAAPKLVDCPECSAVRQQGKPCAACGWRPRPGAESIEVIDGDLVPVDRKSVKNKVWSPDERRRFHSQLVFIAAERGYQDGWCKHKYFEKFGQWPRGYAEPIPPDPETRSWVKSRQIAYAKAREKAAAA
jgi:superfamily II DNA or RNA helicase